MPAKSKQQLKLIYALRGKYKTKEDAPEKYKWAFDKKWTDNVKMKNLPTYEQFLNEGAQRDMNNLAMYLIDLNKELAAETNPKTIKFIKKDIEKAKADLEKIKSKVNEAAEGKLLKEKITYKGTPIKKGDKFRDDEGDIFIVTKAALDKIELKDEDGISTTFPDDFDDNNFDAWFNKSKVNEAADPEVLAAIETVKKVKFGSKRKEAMAIVLAAAKAKTGESARTYKQALQFLDLEDL